MFRTVIGLAIEGDHAMGINILNNRELQLFQPVLKTD